jgi:hypothetical protein
MRKCIIHKYEHFCVSNFIMSTNLILHRNTAWGIEISLLTNGKAEDRLKKSAGTGLLTIFIRVKWKEIEIQMIVSDTVTSE